MKKTLIIIVLLLMTNFAYGETKVVVEIPEYDVTVNETVIDTKYSQYPVLKYKNITYFPMTSDYLSGLGLSLKFSTSAGLEINRKSTVGDFKQNFLGASNTLGSKANAQIASYKISVNGKVIDNDHATYPVLMYKNITYFPMTWYFAVEEFGWQTKWDNKTGFKIITNQMKVLPPKEDVLEEISGNYQGITYSAYIVDLEDFKIKTGIADYIGNTETLSDIAKNHNAVLAINGSYFDAYIDAGPKDPYGNIVVDGEVMHTGDHKATIGVSGNMIDIDRVGKTIYGWNGYPVNNFVWYGYFINHTVYEKWPSVTIFTPARGHETLTDIGTNYIVKNNKIVDIVKNKSVVIPEDGYVVNLHGILGATPERVYERFVVGYSSEYEVTFKSEHEVWQNVEYAVTAGPALVLDGKKDLDLDLEMFYEEKIRTQVAARSAIGYTKNNEVIFLTTTATMDDLADLMLYLDCYEAMNLDGGASSGLWYNDDYIREPGREISNIIYITTKH